jgi:hypothetical protein
MKQVIIRRCPVCPNIGSLTDSVTAALKNEKDVRVQVVDGAKASSLSRWMGGRSRRRREKCCLRRMKS